MCYLCSLLPLILFGFYKNGVKVYLSGCANLLEMFLPLIYVLFAFIIIFTIKKVLKKRFNITDVFMLSTVLFLPLSFNIVTFLILFVICYLLYFTKLKLPWNVIFISLLIFINSYLFSSDIFLNSLELTKNFNYDYSDLFIGYSTSYMFTSSCLAGLMSLIILCLSGYFKKTIVIIFFVLYTLFCLINGFNFTNYSGIIIAVMYVGSFFSFTPITKKWIVIYSVFLSALTILFSFLTNYYVGVFIAILVLQIMSIIGMRKNFTF